MRYRYVTADVFTSQAYGGNPLAVVFDAQGLSGAQMQRIAREFNYSETSFVLPPRDPAHTAWVRIFTPDREVPFAGHPNVGTAVVLAREMAASGRTVPETFVFEEEAGLVRIALRTGASGAAGAQLLAPQPLSRASEAPAAAVARALSLEPADIDTSTHAPQVASVGLIFLVVQLASRDALRRAVPDPAGYAALLPLDGAKSIYAYTTDTGAGAQADVQARMFTGRMTEDPATGSATAAMTALRTALRGAGALRLRVEQGVDMGRASVLLAHAEPRADGVWAGVAGEAVVVMEGTLAAPDVS
ncbi:MULTISPECIES: PhzF family phenazine biosynthesis protein [Achromobacter]|uniref:PhzF family phenazine biosynthesis protein n=1 Tax=Alcaligenes xylosoxydans xylosoxydans TaxID=85698 RepID=A0A424W9Z7_ALCXX|nr:MULTISPECIES: PhzF family phenazine biosynthesis protein [Achromobacter]MBC9907398.1 PhzF family phenazine biosynthesis protein [Achromobacter xylosoxidans]MBD0870892.1 PhzF family phenazine biosynthesis protein [Achromobacter xylosoxidans]QNP83902.1 PhzF family phenazine biosynthesis protein [Achromobacter xylosoxidans]RPJ90139.1 PhzF family phenazine biosynthesis protein [Achromobacter xylosoxidans]